MYICQRCRKDRLFAGFNLHYLSYNLKSQSSGKLTWWDGKDVKKLAKRTPRISKWRWTNKGKNFEFPNNFRRKNGGWFTWKWFSIGLGYRSDLTLNLIHKAVKKTKENLLQLLKLYSTRGPFLERPGNLTGPKSYFEIKFSRKVGCVLTSNEAHFVSLADNFTAQFLNLLKLLSRMKNKTA